MLIPKGLLHAARTFPEKVAMIDGDKSFTYSQFASRTAKLKNSLARLGVKKGDRVAALLLNEYRYLEIMYGTTALGGIIVPLNTRLSADEISFILNDAEVEVLYIHPEFITHLSEIKQKVKGLRHVILVEDEANWSMKVQEGFLHYEELLNEQPDHKLSFGEINEEDVAGLYYTGGTTGRSKGVMLTHKNIVNNAYHSMLYYSVLKEDDIYLHAAPMFHLADGAATFSITLLGATHTFVRSFTPQGVLEVIKATKVTSSLLVPTMINLLLNMPEFDKPHTNSLRTIIYGASPMSVSVLQKGLEKLENVQFWQAYGMTEAAPILTLLHGKDHILDGSEVKIKRLAAAGRPVPGVEMKVVTPDGTEAAVGEVGQFVAKGPNIMKGYWNLPEETANALRDGWYYTGDLGYRDKDYYFYCVDRAKDMIITGGENVYSVEVEQIISQLPEVLECAVVGIPDEKWGESIRAVVALKKSNSLSVEEIISFCRQKLANYKVPKSVEFVSELPKSGAGKILKRNLREKYWQEEGRRVN
ncbi:long-chain-fatty-acid--CoA ligase [Bacillus marasmi]|uniref:long-chain-fatty-acid--CoA ligase n=1 Tax=Bacillus marasmi TaxID=1926279 RepID=UPI0011C79C7F|nr:long-chain-fatty-acid--CoA ligase [Bacillus marasmi]